jgi:hypothetical protein
MSQPLYFSAGLGDVIRVIYRTGAYQQLSEATLTTPVIVASHNPFAIEIFRYHRNSRHFLLYDLGHKYSQFFETGLRGVEIIHAMEAFVGLPLEAGRRLPVVPGYVPIFDAPDEIDSKRHVVFAPFAGADVRTFPETLINQIIGVLRSLSVPVFVVSRSYRRTNAKGRVIHHVEDASKYAGGNIEVVDNLSVPATLNLVRNASAFVGSWSALLQAAWLENKAVSTFYPPGWAEVTNGSGYAFGIGRSNCLHADYLNFTGAALERWLTNIPT